MMLLFWVHPPCGCPTVHEEISDGWFILGWLLNHWIFTWIAVGSVIALKSVFWFLNEILADRTLKTLMLSNTWAPWVGSSRCRSLLVRYSMLLGGDIMSYAQPVNPPKESQR